MVIKLVTILYTFGKVMVHKYNKISEKVLVSRLGYTLVTKWYQNTNGQSKCNS